MQLVATRAESAQEAHLPPGQLQLSQGPPGASCTSRRPPTRPRLLQMMPSAERGTRSRHTTSCRVQLGRDRGQRSLSVSTDCSPQLPGLGSLVPQPACPVKCQGLQHLQGLNRPEMHGVMDGASRATWCSSDGQVRDRSFKPSSPYFCSAAQHPSAAAN